VGALAQIFPPETVAAIINIVEGIQQLAGNISEHIPQMKGIAGMFGDYLKGPWMSTVTNVLKGIGDAIKTLAQFWKQHGDEIMAVVRYLAAVILSVMTVAAATFSAVWTAAVWTFRNIIAPLAGFFAGVAAGIIGVVSGLVGGVIAFFQQFQRIPQVVQMYFNMAVAYIRGLAGQFSSAGSSLINGLISGIQSAASRIYNAVVGPIQNALAGVRNTLGIHSDSAVMQEIAKHVWGGFATGTKEAAPGAVSSMTSAISNITNVGGSTIGGRIGGITIHVYETKNASATADEIVRQLSRRLNFQGVRI
jgi:phage-related protein